MESKDLNLMPVAELCRQHKISKYTIYTLIKTDPTSPAMTIGPKKNYRIQVDLFRNWLEQRLKERHYFDFKVPTADQLFHIGRN